MMSVNLAARALWLIPLFWIAPALIAVIAAGLAVAFSGAFIEGMEPGFDGLRIAVALADGTITRNAPANVRLAVAALLAVLAIVFRRRAPVFAPLALTALGRAAVTGLLFEAFFSRAGWAIAAAVCATGLIALGLRWSIAGAGYWSRAGHAALLLMPAVLVSMAPIGRFGRLPWFVFAPLLADNAVAILLGAIGRTRSYRPLAVPHRWQFAAVTLTAILTAAVQLGGERARAADRQRLHQELAQVPTIAEPAAYPRLFFQRGISLVRDGYRAYYPERTARLLDTLRSHGVDAVALIPYGRASANPPEVRFEINAETRELYRALARLAHARGIRILLKPQLMVFGARFPGELEIADPAARRAWFSSYAAFIIEWARLAAEIHADLFCAGTELVKLSRHEAEWRAIIARIREVYPGPVVYAATQGEEFENLAFWDALDYIGLNNYYPLPDSLDTSALVAKVEAVQKRFGKPVIFTETGYASVDGSHRQPWAEPIAPVSLEHQARCYEALFRAFYNKPWFYGMYWWKVSADGRGGPDDRSLTPWRKPAMETIRRWYATARPETQDQP